MAKANESKRSKATTASDGPSVADKAKAEAKAKADKAKAANRLFASLLTYSVNYIVAIMYKGQSVPNPLRKIAICHAMRVVLGGTPTPADVLRARACFCATGGLTYRNNHADPMRSAKAEVNGYVRHEFVNRKKAPKADTLTACMAFARLLWAGQGTATLSGGQTMPTSAVIDGALKLVPQVATDSK